MRLHFYGQPERLPAPERFRREHEQWLTAAIRSGRRFPRIPLRSEDKGGFNPLRERPNGLPRARRWWQLALERLEVL